VAQKKQREVKDTSPWRKKLRGKVASEAPVPSGLGLSLRGQRALVIAVVLALLAGAYLVGRFFSVIVLSAMAAVLFYPLYARLNRKFNSGLSAMLTFLLMLLVIIIPVILVVFVTINQVEELITALTHLSKAISISDAAKDILDSVNHFLASVSGGHYQISVEQLRDTLAKAAAAAASGFLNLLTSSFSSIASFVTQFILFIYLFTAMLINKDNLLNMFRALNPLGDDVSALYLSRASLMARGVVGGQFVIAIAQGVAGAIFLHIAGLGYFFFFAMVLTLFSIIPLGGGVLVIPIGVVMILTGNVWQGLFVLFTHFFVTTNIDNVLRPHLIPKTIRMNSALMMLAVFGGLGLFGFLGLFIGPILMILIISTLQVYLPLAEARRTGSAKKRP
jgi:predicted PurR-regulated permease PerM